MFHHKDYRWSRISLGCIALDAATNGGISTRGVTEIFGESGVGKTQLLLQLCLMVQLPQNIGGLKKHAVYICTEDIFPSRRLYQLIDKFQQQFDSSISYAENVFVEHIIEMVLFYYINIIRLLNLSFTGRAYGLCFQQTT